MKTTVNREDNMYKLKINNGRVNALLKTGEDFVQNNISINTVEHIMSTGKLVPSDRPDYPICIDGQWYFEGEEVKEPKKANEPKEEK